MMTPIPHGNAHADDDDILEIVSDGDSVASFSTISLGHDRRQGTATAPARAARCGTMAAAFAAFGAIVVLNISMQRQLGAMEETGMGSRWFYNIVGVALLVGCTGIACACVPSELDRHVALAIGGYAACCWAVSVALCYSYPNPLWADYFVVSDGENLAAEVVRECHDPPPSWDALRVHANATGAAHANATHEAFGVDLAELPAYVVLQGTGWLVDAARAVLVTTRSNEVSAAAPIACGFADSGVHAVCTLPDEVVAMYGEAGPPTDVLLETCGWGTAGWGRPRNATALTADESANASTATVHIRRMTASPAFKDADLLLEPTLFEHTKLFEWNAPSLESMREFTAAVDAGDRRQYTYVLVAWAVLTLPFTFTAVRGVLTAEPQGVVKMISSLEV